MSRVEAGKNADCASSHCQAVKPSSSPELSAEAQVETGRPRDMIRDMIMSRAHAVPVPRLDNRKGPMARHNQHRMFRLMRTSTSCVPMRRWDGRRLLSSRHARHGA